MIRQIVLQFVHQQEIARLAQPVHHRRCCAAVRGRDLAGRSAGRGDRIGRHGGTATPAGPRGPRARALELTREPQTPLRVISCPHWTRWIRHVPARRGHQRPAPTLRMVRRQHVQHIHDAVAIGIGTDDPSHDKGRDRSTRSGEGSPGIKVRAVYRQRIDGVVHPRAQGRPAAAVPFSDSVCRYPSCLVEEPPGVEVRAAYSKTTHPAIHPRSQGRPATAIPFGDAVGISYPARRGEISTGV